MQYINQGQAHPASKESGTFVVPHQAINEISLANLARDEARDLLQKISKRVPGMVYQYHLRVDGSSNFPYASEAIREIYRVSPEQAAQNAAHVFAVIHPDDHDEVLISLQQSAADITPWVHEYRVRFENGTVRWLLGNSLSHREPDGSTLWHGFITDITERKNTEALLAEKSQLLSTVLANSRVGIIFERERQHVWANRHMSEMFGYTLEDMAQESSRLFYPSQQSYEDFASAAFPALLRDGHFTTPWEMRCQGGDLRWMNLSGTSVDRHDLRAGTIWVFEDISQQRRTQAKLVVANHELMLQNNEREKQASELMVARDEAESANLAKSRFLATMSHEIRTPMNAVLGMAQVLMQPNISELNRLDYASTILKSGQALMALLNDILDLSKIEAGKVDLEAIALTPAKIICETKSLFDQSAIAKGLKIDADSAGPESHYLGDPNRLRQMLANLVGNAIKFTRQGTIRIQASEIACSAHAATLEFSVSDSGIGIAKDKQAQLFQTFSQADNATTRRYGGTGLGLSIVRTLALAMGGEVGVASEAGVGSRFWFRVRVERLPDDATLLPAQAGVSLTPDAHAAPPQLSGRVLVIEDEPINQAVMRVMLERLGLEVTLANDGQQALETLKSGEPMQLILTDLHMPVMDGYSAAQYIREWEAQTGRVRCPIIAVSADAFAGVRSFCLAAGMDEVLSKPVRQVDLWSALAKRLPSASAVLRAAAVGQAVDPATITALLDEIMPLLAKNKVDAMTHFKVLQDLVAGTELAPEIHQAGLALQEFRFDLTLKRLRRLAIQHQWATAA